MNIEYTKVDIKNLPSPSAYESERWMDGGGKPISADNLNKIEDAVKSTLESEGVINKLTKFCKDTEAARQTDFNNLVNQQGSQGSAIESLEDRTSTIEQKVQNLHKETWTFELYDGKTITRQVWVENQ